MFRFATRAYKLFFPYRSVEASTEAFKAAGGIATSELETHEFVAVSYLESSYGDPVAALRRLEQDGLWQSFDLDDSLYEGIRGWLEYWCKKHERQTHQLATS